MSLVLAALSCGDDATTGHDPAADASLPDGAAAPATVTVRVLMPGGRAPASDAPVLMFDPDGTLHTRTATDGDGWATGSVLAGGSLVAFIRVVSKEGETAYHGRAVLGLGDGDSIVIGEAPVPDLTEPPSTTMTFSLPSFDDADSYTIATTCGRTTQTTTDVSVGFRAGCERSPFSIIASTRAFGTEWEVGSHSMAVTGIVLTDGATEVVTGEWQAALADPIVVTGFRDLFAVRATFAGARIAGDTVPNADLYQDALYVTDPVELTPFRLAAADDGLLALRLTSSSISFGEQRIGWWLAGSGAGGVTVSVPDVVLPWVGPVLTDFGARTFRWVRAGDGSWDGTYVGATWSGQHGGELVTGTWRIALPPGIDEVTLPPIPDDFAAWFPDEIDEFVADATLFDSDQVAGWDEARQLGFDSLWPDYLDQAPTPSLVRYSDSN